MIAKDREKQIIRTLNSTKGIFDAYCLVDTGSSDNTVQVWKDWCKYNVKEFHVKVNPDYKFVEVNGHKILGDFASPRNDSFKLAKKAKANYAFWIDSDDVLVNPEGIPILVEQMNNENLHFCVLTYVYAKGDGNLKPVVQKRERIIDLSIKGKWANRVHENFKAEQRVNVFENDQVYVQHERENENVLETGRRNHLIMKAQEEEEGIKNMDNEMLSHYAYDFWEHKEYEQALKYYQLYLDRKTDNKGILYQVHIKMARAYMSLGELDKAIASASMALQYDNAFSDSYIILAEAYTTLGEWDEAIHYADKVLGRDLPNTTLPINELEYVILPRRIKINAYLQKGMIEQASELINELLQMTGDENVKQEKFMIEKDILRNQAINGINHIMRYLQSGNNMNHADRLREAIPIDLLDDPTVRRIIEESMHDYRRKTRKVKLSGSKSIVIWAGEGIGEWNGESDIKEGIGGSEGMTIQIARELVKLDNKVVIYNQCGNAAGKEFYGVRYEDYRKWDTEMKCDVFVSLRRPDVFTKIIKAKKQYLWLHDTHYGDVNASIFYSADKGIVLSQAHKDVIKKSHGIEDEDIFFMTSNGLNSLAMKWADEQKAVALSATDSMAKPTIARNPYQLFYASSYDRGLDNLLEMWPSIRKEVPEATLKIIYGWNTFDKLMNSREGTESGNWMRNFKSKMVEMIANSEGVQELGRVTQGEHHKLAAESSIWIYPTEFYEISCIGAMIAQSMGAVPVCTPHAALNETVSTKYGVKVDLSSIADATIHLLKNQNELEKKRTPLMKWSRKQYDMAKLAKQWDEEFNNN